MRRQLNPASFQKRYLENKSSYAIARDGLLDNYDEETTDDEEFVLLLKKDVSRKYKHYEEFDFETMDSVQCKAEFRVEKNALRSVAEALQISDTAY